MLRDALADLERSLDSLISLSPGQQAASDLIEGPVRHVCLVGGTRSGKTTLVVRKQVSAAVAHPGSRHAMLRYRSNAARLSLWQDSLPAVRRRYFPAVTWEENRQDGILELPNGSQIFVGGLDDADRVEKVLGLEFATIYLNEASQIPYSSAVVAFTRLAQQVPGLPQKAYVDLNPVGVGHWTNVLFGDKRDPISRLPLRHPERYERAFLNPVDNSANLSPEYIEQLASLSPRQRMRFYEGRYAEAQEGALWSIESLERCRCSRDDLPDMRRVVVAVDPAVSSGEGSAETGVVVAGLGTDGKVYVTLDASGRFSPTQWAERVVVQYHANKADLVIGETNQGGALVENTVKAIDGTVSFKGIHASRGKITRAEPVAALFDAGKVFLAGDFPELEEQMTTFIAGGVSPDRLDAMVYAVTELTLTARRTATPVFGTTLCTRGDADFYNSTPPEWWVQGLRYPPGDPRWRTDDGRRWLAERGMEEPR